MKIILPLDFSENSRKALEFAIFLADKKHASITLVHVIELIYDFASQAAIVLDTMHNDAEAVMKKTIEDHQSTGIQFDYVIKEGTASITIARIAEELKATLIVMGTQGASGIRKTLVGSTTVNTIKEAKVPVLVVPAESHVAQIKKVTLALEFANHEAEFIDWVVMMSEKWGLGLEFIHVQSGSGFKENLSVLGLESYLVKKYPKLPVRIHTYYAPTATEGLDQFLEEHENGILVMCHQHKNLWDQVLSKSQSIKMAYHTHVPLLIMN